MLRTVVADLTMFDGLAATVEVLAAMASAAPVTAGWHGRATTSASKRAVGSVSSAWMEMLPFSPHLKPRPPLKAETRQRNSAALPGRPVRERQVHFLPRVLKTTNGGTP